MKKIILLTAILVVAFTVNAFADHGNAPSPDTEQATVTTTINGIFALEATTALSDPSFTPTEAQILSGASLPAGGGYTTNNGVLTMYSNYNDTTLDVIRDDWASVGDGEGEFTLKVLNTAAAGVTIPNSDQFESPALLGSWSDGVNGATLTIRYQLSGISVSDDPDTYSTTVTYSLSHP